MLCADLTFVLGIDKTSNRAGCIAVAVVLYYFVFASFLWMVVEAVFQYLNIIGTNIRNFMRGAAIFAWGEEIQVLFFSS